MIVAPELEFLHGHQAVASLPSNLEFPETSPAPVSPTDRARYGSVEQPAIDVSRFQQQPLIGGRQQGGSPAGGQTGLRRAHVIPPMEAGTQSGETVPRPWFGVLALREPSQPAPRIMRVGLGRWKSCPYCDRYQLGLSPVSGIREDCTTVKGKPKTGGLCIETYVQV